MAAQIAEHRELRGKALPLRGGRRGRRPPVRRRTRLIRWTAPILVIFEQARVDPEGSRERRVAMPAGLGNGKTERAPAGLIRAGANCVDKGQPESARAARGERRRCGGERRRHEVPP
jgi:hypothetical protein